MSAITFNTVQRVNNRPTNLLSKLSGLKKNYSAVGIKTSFEDEGTTFNNAVFLRNLTLRNNMKLVTKIGGAEAKTDFKLSNDVGVDGIVGPMIESEFAFEKFTETIHKSTLKTHGINIESKQGVENLDKILNSENINKIDYVCIGRTDLSASYGIKRDVTCEKICKIVKDVATKVKSKKLKVYMGGSLSVESLNFIKLLHTLNLIDYVETRYIIFKVDDNLLENFSTAFKNANEFEQEYMLYLAEKYKEESDKFMNRCNDVKTRI